MLYIYYLVILPIIYSICNIFYFIYKFKFFPWKRFNIWYINNWEFERHYLNQNKRTLGNAGTNPLYTFLIVNDEDKLKEAFAKAVEHQVYSETPQLTIKYLKEIYYESSTISKLIRYTRTNSKTS
jgi:hypothetical protein